MAKGQNAMAISKFFEAKRTNQPLQIHGDGTQRRDMLHIDDAIDAFLLLREKGQANEIYNVGSGNNISIKELADIVSSDQTHVPPRPGIEYDTLADISKIESLGFKVRTDVRSWVKEKLTSDSF
jgi:nucleoside-diphosphate-sugar epimerase